MDLLQDHDYMTSMTNLLGTEDCDCQNHKELDAGSVKTNFVTNASSSSDSTFDTFLSSNCTESTSFQSSAEDTFDESESLENSKAQESTKISQVVNDAVVKIVWTIIENSSSSEDDEEKLVSLPPLSKKRKRRIKKRRGIFTESKKTK